ncbi:2'-5' RNA ligase family protein [Pseudonocardia sp. CA-107938]|uniref:2'-5' RNA ligase family protein n=1 Tax=Pseudonocardia sp. CA-107938 TaxID=3240021 RepID=UPI003D950925
MDLLSAVIVPVPAAEPLVGALRAELDRHAALGVPAHVTVMAPFLPAAALDAATVADLAAVVATVPAFDVAFTQVRWFDDRLVYLAPEPAAPFVALTEAVGERFGLQPYGGEHEPVPHLTVAYDAPAERLQAVAAELAGGLPVVAEIDQAVLYVEADGRWAPHLPLPLGTRSGSGARIRA